MLEGSIGGPIDPSITPNYALYIDDKNIPKLKQLAPESNIITMTL